MRAQSSIIMLLGFLFLIAIVIYYASYGFTPDNLPTGVGEEQMMVQEMIEGIITSGTELSLKAMELQGGYIIPPEDSSVAFTYIGVPYWQVCQNDISPTHEEIKERFMGAIKFYVNENIQHIKDFFGKNLSISNVTRVDVDILDKRIDVAVYMPTRLEGSVMRQPYRTSVPTNFKQLFDFAKDTITEINKDPAQGGRFMETFTISSIYRSRYLPTFGMMTECGEILFLTPQHISENLEILAAHTIAHTTWWEEPQPDYYGITTVNGKEYKNLEPTMAFPDGFKVTSPTSIQLKNDKWLARFPVPIRICLFVYNIKYNLGYPVVINLNDSETGYDFNFAIYVNVDDMLPGDCDVIPTVTGTDPCADPQCNANIKVEDCSGNPLSGAEAYMGACLIGTSDANGIIEGPIQCGTDDLYIRHSSDYDYFSGTVSSSSLVDATYKLCKINDLTVQFSEKSILGHIGDEVCHPCASPTDCSDTPDRYTCDDIITNNCAFMTVTSIETGDIVAQLTNHNPDDMPDECEDFEYIRAHPDICLKCSSTEITGQRIPVGNYDVTITLMDQSTSKHMGYLQTNLNLLETTTHLTVNVPNFGIPTSTPEPQNYCGISRLGGCGIEPLVQR